MVPYGLALIALAIGVGLGYLIWGRRVRVLETERLRAQLKLRAHVVPVLARRAGTLELPRDAARDDSLEAAVELASRIQSAEEKLVLPFSDTLEIKKAELGVRRS